MDDRSAFHEGERAFNFEDYAEAARLFEEAADLGSASAAYMLGFLNEQDGYFRDDKKTAERGYRLAAEKGDVHAQVALGELMTNIFFHRERIVPNRPHFFEPALDRHLSAAGIDPASEALKWFNKAVEQGSASAAYYLGLISERSGDLKEAVKRYRQAGEQGDFLSQMALGSIFFLGDHESKGVPGDYDEAAKWFLMAAIQGRKLAESSPNERGDLDQRVDAQLFVGRMYEQGRGFPEDFQKAIEWYRPLAERPGSFQAQYLLAEMYVEGKGVKPDLVEAYALFSRAALLETKRPFEKALGRRDEIAEQMTPFQITAANRKYQTWKNRNPFVFRDHGSGRKKILGGKLPMRRWRPIHENRKGPTLLP